MVDAMEVDEERPTQHAQQLRKAETLNHQQLQQMLDRVIKLTAENKITKENAWDLNAITFMPEIIRSEAAHPDSFNFQRASCGLDASVRIYSKRIDATQELVYMSLRMTKGVQVAAAPGSDDEGDDTAAGSQGDQDKGDGSQGKEAGVKGKRGRRGAAQPDLDPSATLAEAEALKDRRAENTFESDPLFNRTTKLFDENSASGLLLLNYPVYCNCHILFNSDDRPLDAFPTPRPQQPAIKLLPKVDLTALAPTISQLQSAAATLRLNPSFSLLQAELLSQPASVPAIRKSPMDIINAAFAAEARIQPQAVSASHNAAQATASQSGVHLGSAEEQQEGCEWGSSIVGGDIPQEASAAIQVAQYPEGAIGQGPADAVAYMEESMQAGPHSQPSASFAEPSNDDIQGVSGWGDDGGDGLWGDGSHSAMLQAAIRETEGDSSLDGREHTSAMVDVEAHESSIQHLLSSALGGGRQGGSLPAAAGRRPGTAWAGAAFWRYRPAASAAAAAAAAGVVTTSKGRKARSTKTKAPPADIDFLSSWEPSEQQLQMAQDTGQLCARRTVKASTLRPVDIHFEVPRLYRLSCAPALNTAQVWHLHVQHERCQQVLVRGAAASHTNGGVRDEAEFTGWGADRAGDDDGVAELVEEPMTDVAAGMDGATVLSIEGGAAAGAGWDPLSLDFLLPPVRKVTQVDIAYDRTAKQVNVKALKDSLRNSMAVLHAEVAGVSEASQLNFQQVISRIPAKSTAGGTVHLCFLCLLHLANETGLALSNMGSLSQLVIQVPPTF